MSELAKRLMGDDARRMSREMDARLHDAMLWGDEAERATDLIRDLIEFLNTHSQFEAAIHVATFAKSRGIDLGDMA